MTVVCSWSGGLDSTALAALLLTHGHDIELVSLFMPAEEQAWREKHARATLQRTLEALGPGRIMRYDERPATFLEAFTQADGECPTRNRRIIDNLIASHGAVELGLGEYIGCDTWLVQDHVGAADCDARSLTGYIVDTYGLGYRLWTLSDFGTARYKVDRVRLAHSVLGDAVSLVTSCLLDKADACGRCYKCIELHVAFELAGLEHLCPVTIDRGSRLRGRYIKQMQGADVKASAWEGKMS